VSTACAAASRADLVFSWPTTSMVDSLFVPMATMAFGKVCPAPSITCQLGALYMRKPYSWLMYRFPWVSSRIGGGGGGAAGVAIASFGAAFTVLIDGGVASLLATSGISGRAAALLRIVALACFFTSTGVAAGSAAALFPPGDSLFAAGFVAALVSSE